MKLIDDAILRSGRVDHNNINYTPYWKRALKVDPLVALLKRLIRWQKDRDSVQKGVLLLSTADAKIILVVKNDTLYLYSNQDELIQNLEKWNIGDYVIDAEGKIFEIAYDKNAGKFQVVSSSEGVPGWVKEFVAYAIEDKDYINLDSFSLNALKKFMRSCS